jgi:K+-transporting ATPase KdpF subunit
VYASPSFSFVNAYRQSLMSLDLVLGIIVTVGLLAYLVYVLLRPERF